MPCGRLYRVLGHGVSLLLAAGPVAVPAQAAGPFTPGGQQLVLLDFSAFPLGVVPVSRPGQCLPGIPVCDITGELEVVMQQGVPMLRASARSSFVVRLPQRLPGDFTLEFDLIPKNCCQPEDLAFEGTPLINQGVASANVLWHHNSHAIVGGVATGGFSAPMPEHLKVAVMGSLANIAVSFRGTAMTMYTNGVEVYSVQRDFVRGSVLRVFLGGQNDTDQAVYLARLRIAGTAPVVSASVPAVAGSMGPVVRTGSAGRGAAATGRTTPVKVPAASHTMSLKGFTGTGAPHNAPQTFTLKPIVAAGVSPAASHTFSMIGFTATGAGVITRTFTLSGLSANGGRSTSPRTFSLAGWTASGPGTP